MKYFLLNFKDYSLRMEKSVTSFSFPLKISPYSNFIECLLCARYCFRGLDYINEQKEKKYTFW